MARIASKLVVALVIVILLLALWLQSARHDAEKAQASSDHYQRAAESLIESIGMLEEERARKESMAVDAVKRLNATQAARERDRAERKRLKETNETLRAYLDSRIPAAVAGWLWLPADAAHADSPTAADLLVSGNAKTTAAGANVAHGDGWQWCKDVERALDACNADKRALREW